MHCSWTVTLIKGHFVKYGFTLSISEQDCSLLLGYTNTMTHIIAIVFFSMMKVLLTAHLTMDSAQTQQYAVPCVCQAYLTGFPVRLSPKHWDNCFKWEMVRVILQLIRPSVSFSNILRPAQFYLTPSSNYKCTKHLWTLLCTQNHNLPLRQPPLFFILNAFKCDRDILYFSSFLCWAPIICSEKSFWQY